MNSDNKGAADSKQNNSPASAEPKSDRTKYGEGQTGNGQEHEVPGQADRDGRNTQTTEPKVA